MIRNFINQTHLSETEPDPSRRRFLKAACTLLTLPMAVTSVHAGMDWLSDTLNGVDIYTEIVKTPNIFFDPNSTATKSLGTYKYPYNTQSALQKAVAGNMEGQVIGFKRGSTLRVTGTNGLALNLYGAADNPVTICPYDEALSLPIITSGSNVTWILYDAYNNIWSYAAGATEHDIWRNNVRIKKVAYKGVAGNGVAGTLTDENRSTFTSSTLYLKLPVSENANDGLTEISVSDFALDIRYTNVSATGYIYVCGLDVREARNSAFRITRPTTGYKMISTVDDIKVVGCRVSGGGVDNNLIVGRDALIISGPTNAIRISNLYIAGNYITDALNNAVEVSATSGVIVEHNVSYNCGGHSICEFWSSNNDGVARYNLGDLSGVAGGVYIQAGGGVFFANHERDTDGNDATNAKNHDNSAYFNLITRPRLRGLYATGGTGHKFQHNTVYFDPDATAPGVNSAGSAFQTAGTAATGFCNISNNLFYWYNGVRKNRYPAIVYLGGTLGSAASVPSGDNNIYFTNWASSNAKFTYNNASVGNFTTYKSALSAYSLDQKSLCSTKNSGGTLTEAGLGFVRPTAELSESIYEYAPSDAYMPIASVAVGLKTLTSIGEEYFDGTPYSASSATIGALKGY